MKSKEKTENRSARDSRAHASPQCAHEDTSTTGIGKLDFSYYQGTTAKDHTLTSKGDVRIKLMVEHICPPDVLIRDLYFEGGDILRCYRGRFRFTLEGHALRCDSRAPRQIAELLESAAE